MQGQWSFDDFSPEDMAPKGDPKSDCTGAANIEDLDDSGVDIPEVPHGNSS